MTKSPTKTTKTKAIAEAKLTAPATDDAVIIGFDYDSVNPEIAEKLKATAERVHKLAEHILDIGRELRARREDCFSGGQGKNAGIWGAWLEGEFGMSATTAWNYINAVDLVDRYSIVEDLRPTAIYALASPSTPETAIDEVIERLEAGETLKGKEVAEIIADRKKKANELKGGKLKKPKSAPMDVQRGTTFTANDPHPADGEDNGEAEDGDADEPVKRAEHWRNALSELADDCVEASTDFIADIDEHEFEVPPETVALVEDALKALTKLAYRLGIDTEEILTRRRR